MTKTHCVILQGLKLQNSSGQTPAGVFIRCQRQNKKKIRTLTSLIGILFRSDLKTWKFQPVESSAEAVFIFGFDLPLKKNVYEQALKIE